MDTSRFLMLAVIFFSFFNAAPGPENDPVPHLTEVKHKTLVPEGIAVHPVDGKIYLSSLHENKIVVVGRDGTTGDVIASGQDGFMWGLGMKFSPDGKILWACSADGNGKTALFKIEVQRKKVLERFSHDAAGFLNDLVVLKNGSVFVTDTEKSAIFKLENGALHPWLINEQLKWANGIAISDNERYLFVASGQYGIQRINIKEKTMVSATGGKTVDHAIDGLVYHGQILYAAIGWPQNEIQKHRILRYRLDSELNFIKADTLGIGHSYLNCITTLAINKDQLFAIGNTNLGIYNRHQQKLEKIMDSLSNPVVSIFPLRR